MNEIAIQHLCKDPEMAQLVTRIGPIYHDPKRVEPFESLVHAIIHQQLSGKAAGTILSRFQSFFSAVSFPAPEAVAEVSLESLRSVGLSRAKASYILGIAGEAVRGSIPSLEECDKMADGEIITRLTSLKGVGRWTVEMFLIFNLGRPDILPLHDLGVQRGFHRLFGKRVLPAPEFLSRRGERWGPFRTAAALYLWRAADTPTGI
jgi:DNA-3-methyladenine glycosylase II